ncbi:THUMP-like domain-containing protein [Robiginitalea sp. IMCC44478]|uniref:THUMP-like domain-containing protein n=1 Tax=Robiginitalea sp. IMCC44478 TaxID=3459122 RepID=UPI0040428625
MNKKLLNTGVQDFIRKNLKADILSVSLSGSPFPDIDSRELAQQLAGLQKAEKKLPLWFEKRAIYYPPGLNLEQSSSQLTAEYKAALVSGKSLLDLTGGFGVDSVFFSRQVESVLYCEHNAELAAVARHNFKILGVENIQVYDRDGLSVLDEMIDKKQRLDWVYADPSRRDSAKRKVFLLEDCEPNIPEILSRVFQLSPRMIIKTSPMLDLQAARQTLSGVREVHILAVKNEVKELLFLLEDQWEGPWKVVTVNLQTQDQTFSFYPEEEPAAESSYSMPLQYLYEPNAAILKSGAFKLAGSRYGLQKLHRHTHLFTSENLIDYPGRRFEIKQIVPYKPGKLPFSKANISCRNFPETVARVRKRNKISAGGDQYLFFVRCADESFQVIETSKV